MSPAALDLAMSLTPCVPLATLLAAAAMGGSPAWGAAMGVSFGLGRWLRLGGGAVLIALSLRRLSLGW